jgi:SMC interacting uncharacterized protein involved in chromosome segregation
MTWAGEALAALRKIITLEERVATFTDDIHDLTRIVRDLDHRLVKLETKLEVYERVSEKSRSRRLPSQDSSATRYLLPPHPSPLPQGERDM